MFDIHTSQSGWRPRGSAAAPFVHGSFTYLAYQASAYAAASTEARQPLGALIVRTLRLLFGAYFAVFVLALLAWLWFIVAVLSGRSGLPLWMALANPLLIAIGWFALRRVLPRRIADYTEGAGLNSSNIIFLGLLSAALW